MSLSAKVVFPAPPPTTNDLTTRQRALLVRKTKKIEQLLGSTPYLVDSEPIGPVHISLPYAISKRHLMNTRRPSVDSTSSSSSSDGSPLPSPTKRSNSIRSTDSRRSQYTTSSFNSSDSLECWPAPRKIPILRLAMKSLRLETIPASPLSTRTSFGETNVEPPSPNSSTEDLSPSANDALAVSPCNSILLTTFTIPSVNSLRKQKMDRLRKKLGTGVPLELVFRNDTVNLSESGTSDNFPSSLPSFVASTGRGGESSPLSPPGPMTRSKKPTQRIVNTRDSIVDSVSIHRAKRQGHASTFVPIYKKTRTESAPAPPAIPTSNFKRVKEKLSLIVESPDEHGNGCSEDFDLSSVSTNHSMPDFESDQGLSAAEAEVKLWNRYEGWAPQAPSHATAAPSSPVDSPPTSPDPSPSTVEMKKRPSSYRKPPPPIPDACC